MKSVWKALGLFGIFAVLVVGGVVAQENKDGFPEPELVTLPGTFQDAIGCPGEWQPECERQQR
ncbi:MAG: hypothetical protein IPK52_16040 [Chloroflexi bacterium]|nr:hypothetical protein [Chloroflexota bacterium]